MDMNRNDAVEGENVSQRFEVLDELGGCYAAVGDYVRAQECYEKAASLGPDEAAPYVGLGVVALQKNLPEDAEIAFRVACRLDPGCSKAYAGLAMLAQQRADYERAFDLYLKCLEGDTDNLTALLGLFQVSCQMGSFAKVIHYLEVYLQSHRSDTSVMFSLAALYLKEGLLDQSAELLSKVLALDPSNKDAVDLMEEVEHGLAERANAVVEAE